ncbi:P1 family peptidase [Corynebacterium epidermidicanis]|uniref:L-aminopeptidase/D-esterase n=1 Tax=Corynebacterium epidermidicanis TaxID=1050174 RepID=A0A0G3GRV6_9CORY|nr:P1 family peptidase [Corynebacterium epidermidicanis]AKK03854.1 L-aminopeptidase/D-esterase [Corynebacterium epidermidicanis]
MSDAPGLLCDVPGVYLGHCSLGDTGVSVVVVPDGAYASVDVRGGGPGTRETDLLEPHNTVQQVHAITLAGGSAFGLAAADGVMLELEEHGIGFAVLGADRPGPKVPIVPGAVIFDLLVGDPNHRPGPAEGRAAVRSALTGDSTKQRGSVGAGCAATAGVLRGGFGQASMVVGDWVVAAAVVANPVGAVVDKDSGLLWGDPTKPSVDTEKFGVLKGLETKLNTTIGVIATNAPVTKAQAKRLAMTGHDGLARAVRPAHSPLDGDTLFALSTGDGSGVAISDMVALSAAAADVVCAAIVDAVVCAKSGYGLSCWSDIGA